MPVYSSSSLPPHLLSLLLSRCRVTVFSKPPLLPTYCRVPPVIRLLLLSLSPPDLSLFLQWVEEAPASNQSGRTEEEVELSP